MEEPQNEFENENGEMEEEEEEYKKKDQYELELLKASQKGDFEKVKLCIEKKANINFMNNKKWTAFLWASCNGHVDILKYLIEKGAANLYTDKKDEVKKEMARGNIEYNVRPNPLIWCCYKGHYRITWALLKLGLDWEEIDGFGNNSMHQAASGDSLETVKVLLTFGATGGIKNTRGHEAKDLATNQEIISLFEQQDKALAIDPLQKHWCSNCKRFFPQTQFHLQWVYEHHLSTTQDKLDGKCTGCRDIIHQHEQDLKHKITQHNYQDLKQKIDLINDLGLEVGVKLMKESEEVLEKFKTQDNIRAFLATLERVDNYKTILRSVGIIDDLVSDAQKRKVLLDGDVVDQVNKQRERLVSERNLRFQLDNLDPSVINIEDVKNLEELLQVATDNQVEQDYLHSATVLRDKLNKNIKANEIFKLFAEYPLREYPPLPMLIDPKSKKPIDPKTKKPIDPKLIPPAPKKKKKEPKFVFPVWATEIPQLQEKITELNGYIAEKDYINLSNEKIEQSKEDRDRMNQELRFRKLGEEQLKLDAEFKATQKKK